MIPSTSQTFLVNDLAAGRAYDLCVLAVYDDGATALPATRVVGCVQFTTAGDPAPCRPLRAHFLGGTMIIAIGGVIVASVLVFIVLLMIRYKVYGDGDGRRVKGLRSPPRVSHVCSQTNGAGVPQALPPPSQDRYEALREVATPAAVAVEAKAMTVEMTSAEPEAALGRSLGGSATSLCLLPSEEISGEESRGAVGPRRSRSGALGPPASAPPTLALVPGGGPGPAEASAALFVRRGLWGAVPEPQLPAPRPADKAPPVHTAPGRGWRGRGRGGRRPGAGRSQGTPGLYQHRVDAGEYRVSGGRAPGRLGAVDKRPAVWTQGQDLGAKAQRQDL